MAETESTHGKASGGGFPETLWTLVREAGQADAGRSAQALAALCAAYRDPVFAWLRARGMDEDQAHDATHDLIQHLLERGNLSGCRPQAGRFRHYLLAALRNLLEDQAAARETLKRGRGWTRILLEKAQLAAPTDPPELRLDAEFAAVVHRRAVDRIRERWQTSGRAERFEQLQLFVLRRSEEGEYVAAGKALGLSRSQVKRSVFDLREDYFEAFRQEVAQTVMVEDLADEVRYLVGLLARQS